MTTSNYDKKFMKIALKTGQRGIGFTEPNPLVGAVVVKHNRILSTGYHQKYGHDHAERIALKNIREPDTTLYVSLEPCCHHGNTPPCTDYIIKKKVQRVVVALIDPNPLVRGEGIKILAENGIKTTTGVLAGLAKTLNRHYLAFIEKKRPYITIRAGVSLDGKLSDHQKNSQWVTAENLREYSHHLRGEYSAVLTGSGTVMRDNPDLTIRDQTWKNKKIYRIILDSSNKLEKNLNIFKNQDKFPLIIFSSRRLKNPEKKTGHHFFVKEKKDLLDLEEVLSILYRQNICSIFIEAGGKIIDSFLKEDLFDEIILFTADKLLGGKNSIELFSSGTKISKPLRINNYHILALDNGHILRGFK